MAKTEETTVEAQVEEQIVDAQDPVNITIRCLGRWHSFFR